MDGKAVEGEREKRSGGGAVVEEGELLRHIAILPFNAPKTSEMTAEAALD